MTKFFCKMMSFKETDLQDLFFGQLNAVDWKNNVKHMKKCMYFLFQALGGFQCRHHELRSHEEGKPDIERPEECGLWLHWGIRPGRMWKTDNSGGSQSRSQRVLLPSTKGQPSWWRNHCATSPTNDGVLAQVHENWPLTLFDLDNRFLKVLAPLVPSLVDKALGFHGVSGAGKTPAARTIAMAISRMWLKKMGNSRQACEFDFFRGQTGSSAACRHLWWWQLQWTAFQKGQSLHKHW